MPLKNFTYAVKAIKIFNYTELKLTKQLIQSRMSEDLLGQVIAEKESGIDSCPHCGSEYLLKWVHPNRGSNDLSVKPALVHLAF